jgi:flagellar hook-length control protein FliK
MLPGFMSSELFSRTDADPSRSPERSERNSRNARAAEPTVDFESNLSPTGFDSMLRQSANHSLRDDLSVQSRGATEREAKSAPMTGFGRSSFGDEKFGMGRSRPEPMPSKGTDRTPMDPPPTRGSAPARPSSEPLQTSPEPSKTGDRGQLVSQQPGSAPTAQPAGQGSADPISTGTTAASGAVTGDTTLITASGGSTSSSALDTDASAHPARADGKPSIDAKSTISAGFNLPGTQAVKAQAPDPAQAASAKSHIPVQAGINTAAKPQTPVQPVLDPSVTAPVPTAQSPALKTASTHPVQNKASIAAIGDNAKGKSRSPGASQASSAPSATTGKPSSLFALPTSNASTDAPTTGQNNTPNTSEMLAAQPRAAAAAPVVAGPLEGGASAAPQSDTLTGMRQDADLSLSRAQTSTGLERPAAHAQRFTPQTLNQLAAQISSRFNKGNRVFDIRLDPAELGRVDVRLEMTGDQRVSAVLTVERAETLAELQRAARDLERALNEAGLELDGNGLEFQLSEGDEDGGDGENDNEMTNVYADSDGVGMTDHESDDVRPRTAYGFMLARRDRIDVRA